MRTVVISVVALLAGCAVPQPENTPVQQKLLTEPNTGAGYYLYVPSTYRSDKPAPLVVTCHGTWPYDVAGMHIREWKMLGENYGCIVVAPALTATDGLFGSGPVAALLHDEARIMSIIGQLHYLYNIDRRNVLITGFSGGGFPTYFVGLRHPDVFTCVIARNGNFNRDSIQGWYPPEAIKTPVFIYYGENDPSAIRTQSENGIGFLRSAGFAVDTSIIPGAGHERHPEVAMQYWLRHWNGQPPTRP